MAVSGYVFLSPKELPPVMNVRLSLDKRDGLRAPNARVFLTQQGTGFSGSATAAVFIPAPKCTAGDSFDDLSEQAAGDVRLETERVIVSTERDGRTARAISHESEYISPRQVRGSLTFQFGVNGSICLESPDNAMEEDDAEARENFDCNTTRSEETSSSGDSTEGVWRSETYLRQALKKSFRYREVELQFQGDSPGDQRSESRMDRRVDLYMERSELYAGAETYPQDLSEEEQALRRAVNEMKQIAFEIFKASLRAGTLGPNFTKDIISHAPQFVDRIVTEAVALKQYSKSKEMSFNSRARLYIKNSKVVDLVKWLKHQSINGPRIGRLISAADEWLGAVKSRIEWLKSLYVRGRDLALIIEKYPQILQLSLEDLNKNIRALETAGLQRMWMGLVVSRQPGLLTMGNNLLQQRIAAITELGVSSEQFGIMVYKFPAVIGHFSAEEVLLRVDYLRQLGISDSVLAKILSMTPQLLACNIEQSWDRLLRYFYFLRIDISGVRRIIGVSPSVFCLNLEANIAPKVKFLLAVGVYEEAVGQLIVDFPAILTYSLDNKIRPLIRFLLEEAGVDEGQVGKVICMQPDLIRYSVQNKLRALVQFFLSKKIRRHELGGMIGDFPALLKYGIPTLQPKFQYLVRVMKKPVSDLVIFPRYFSYSLQSRIVPRHEILVEKGMILSLRAMLACSDDAFSNKVKIAGNAGFAGIQSTDFGKEVPVEGEPQECLTPSNCRSIVQISARKEI